MLKPEENAKNADDAKSLERKLNIELFIINFVEISMVSMFNAFPFGKSYTNFETHNYELYELNNRI